MLTTALLAAWLGSVAAGYSLAGAGVAIPLSPIRHVAQLALMGVGLVMSWLVVRVLTGSAWRRPAGLLLLGAVCCVGAACGVAGRHFPGPSTVDGFIGRRVLIDARVTSVSGGETIQQLQLAVMRLATRGSPARAVTGGVQMSIRTAPLFFPGQHVVALGQLVQPTPRRGQGLADYLDRLDRAGVYAELRSPDITPLAPARLDPVALVSRARARIATAVRDILPEPEATLVLGEMAGIRGTLPPDVQAALVGSGLAHILAISGIKVAVVCGLLQSLTRSLPGRRAALLSIAGVAVYTVVGGASASAVRSAIMGSLALLATVLRRDTDTTRSLLLAGGVMVGARPSLVADLSFQYSFLGVAGIHLYADGLSSRLHRVPQPFREALAVSIAAQLATIPLTAEHFAVVPLLGPLPNALVVPALPLSIAAGFAITVLHGAVLMLHGAPWLLNDVVRMFLGMVAALEFALAHVTLLLARLFASVPGAVLHVPSFPAAYGWSYYAALAVATLTRQRRWPRPKWLGAAALAAAGVLIIAGRPDGRLHVHVLPVPGPALLFTAPDGASLLVDGGSSATKLAPALGAALPTGYPLPRLGPRVDAIAATGAAQQDIGALAGAAEYRARFMLLPADAPGIALARVAGVGAAAGSRLQAVRPGDELEWHGLYLRWWDGGRAGQLALEVGYGASHFLVAEGSGRDPATLPSGSFALADLGLGQPIVDSGQTRAELVAVHPAASAGGSWTALAQTLQGRLWDASREGMLSLTCDRRGCQAQGLTADPGRP